MYDIIFFLQNMTYKQYWWKNVLLKIMKTLFFNLNACLSVPSLKCCVYISVVCMNLHLVNTESECATNHILHGSNLKEGFKQKSVAFG